MKKIFFLLITLSASLLTYSQVYKSGPVTSPETWSGTVYLTDDVTITSTVTINAGTKVLFKENDITLLVDDSGSIVANGTPENEIYFSADHDEDGNYGEDASNNTEGDFEERGLKFKFYPTSGSKGNSSFNYCIIEFIDNSDQLGSLAYGAVDISGSVVFDNCILRNNGSLYGGAIFLRSSSKVTINNSIFQDNEAVNWGGGIYFGGASGLISNCEFKNNTASSGGGIYVLKGSPIIKNCILHSNNSSGTGTGIYLNQASSAFKLINTTIAANSGSTSSKDFAVITTDGSLPSLINSIIWGTDIGTLDASKISVTNCALQGFSNSGEHTSSISLSSANSDPNGPNFNAVDGSDWSLTENSPCIDKGLDNSSDPDVPLTDFLGNPRSGTTDIGAYEYISLVFTWQGDDTSNPTMWNDPDNWDSGIVPSGNENVTIPSGLSNYPVGSASQDYTIGSGKQMIIEAGARLTLNDLTNNGTLKLNHDAIDFASLILNSYTRGSGGTEEIQLYLSGGGSVLEEDYKWHYISSPVSSLSTDIFTGITLNLAQFAEGRPSTSLMQGWVAYDGYVYSSGQTNGPTFSSLTPGKGYDYFHDTDKNYTFSGLLNTSGVIMPLSYSGIPVTMHGFNLLGNPFSSGLNWDNIVDGVYGTYPSNTSKGLYFTRNNDQCSYIAGVGIPSDVTGIIPPMQGFFTKTYSTGNSITLPAEARTHNNIHQRYKGDNIIPLVRLALYEDTESNDETVVRFDEKALAELDNDFDAVKMFLSSEKTSIHTRLDDTDFAINGLPYPPDESAVEIPVVVNVISNSMHKISSTQLQGLDNYNVILKDKLTGYTADLKATPDLTFSAPPETISDRFVLIVKYITTGYDAPVVRINEFNIYHAYNFINIETIADDWAGKTGSVRVLDMTGKRISESLNVEFNKNSLIQIQSPRGKGLYLVEIGSGKDRYVGKIIIR